MADSDDILIALRRITRAIDLHSRSLLKQAGMTAPQLVVLQAIAAEGQITAGALAQQVLLSQATVTSILDRLQAAGLVTRERDAPDRRVVRLALTGQGRQRLAEAPGLLQSQFVARFNALEAVDRQQLVDALQQVATMMDADQLDAAPVLAVGGLDTVPPVAGN